MTDFTLDTDIHLHRARTLVVRCKQPNITATSLSGRQEVADVVRIWGLEIERVPGQNLLPKRQNLRYLGAHWLITEIKRRVRRYRADKTTRVKARADRNRLRQSAQTGASYRIEGSGL